MTDPQLAITLTCSHGAGIRTISTPTFSVEFPRTDKRHGAKPWYTLPVPTIPGVHHQDLIILTLYLSTIILGSIIRVIKLIIGHAVEPLATVFSYEELFSALTIP